MAKQKSQTKPKKDSQEQTRKKKSKAQQYADKKLGKTKDVKRKTPKTVQQSIPISGFYENGMIETVDGYFTQTYLLEDIDFKTASQEVQEDIFEKFGNLLNSIDSDSFIQFTIDNKRMSESQFKRSLMLKRKDDDLDDLRDEFNDAVIGSAIKKGRSNIRHFKYMTICLPCEGVDDAVHRFASLESAINAEMRKISKNTLKPMNINERLNLLYHFLNRDDEEDFYQEVTIQGKRAETFNFSSLSELGVGIKSLIAPSRLNFENKHVEVNGGKRAVFMRTLYLSPKYPTRLSTDIISDITNIPYDMTTTVNHLPFDTHEATELVETELMKARASRIKAEQKAFENNYSPENISNDIKKSTEDAEELLDDLQEGDEKMFFTSVLVTLYGKSEQELDDAQTALEDATRKDGVKWRMSPVQELGFKDMLPLCNCELKVGRRNTTTTASLFLPYENKEMSNKGFYYGLHQVSKNLITYDRESAVNGNGIITGASGSGKTFATKMEMVQAILGTDDYIFILDPQGEYTPFIERMGGQEVLIQPKSGVYINPLDLTLASDGETDPIASKLDYITSICETALSASGTFTPYHKAIIERCVEILYRGYINYIQKEQENGNNITIDREKMPVLRQFHEILDKQKEEVAKEMAVAIAPFALGRQDTFAHRTNINRDNRIISYNFKNMTKTMTELGLSICLNDMWNGVLENFRKGRTTRIYLDELHVYFNHQFSAQYVVQAYKMLRKWGGILTGITQNMGDMFKSEVRDIGDALINNSAFALLLSQGATDVEKVADIYRIPEEKLDYVLDGGAGQGLMITDLGANIVPFVNDFPMDTQLYKYMSSKPKDFQENFMF